MNGLWGTFSEAALERQFRKEDFEVAVRRFVRFSVPLAVVVYLAYGIHDALVVPEVRNAAWGIRYGVFAPVAAILVWFVFKKNTFRRHQGAMLAFGVAVNVPVIWIGAIAPLAGFFIYTGYAVIFVTLGPFLARMNVKTQIVYTAVSLLIYDAFDIGIAHTAPMIRLSMNLTMLTLGMIGALAARQIEVQARLAFLQRRIIREQMAALDAERHKSEALLLNILPQKIAERLKGSSDVIAERFESATVLFSDIVGFTELSARLAPDELVRKLDDVFSRFDRIAAELELEKIKTIGDAYMVCGGIPSAREDHAQAVCEMAVRMRDCVAELGEDLAVRIGVNTGPVVAGVIGKKKFSYDVWGDTVNTASRMESHGVPGAIQVSESTYQAATHLFEFECRGDIQVKGKGQMKTYLLIRRRPTEARHASLPKAPTQQP